MQKFFDKRAGDRFGASDFTRIHRTINALSGLTATPPLRVISGPFGPILTFDQPRVKLIGKPDADIAANTGVAPGSGTVSVWRKKSNGELADTGENQTVYNLASSAMTAGAFITAWYSVDDGCWYGDFEDCGDV